jgi:hypothetical protein
MGTITKEGTISAHPASYDTSHHSYASINSSYPITNAYTDSSSTNYCQVNWKTGSNAESYVYLKFNFSAIPVGATIKNVTAKAKGYVNTTNSSRVTSRQMQLATGTTLKGSALTMSTSTSEQTFSSVGTWTRAELLDAGIRYYVKRGTSNTSSSYNFRMYGATMTVTYEYQETTYTITVSNSSSATVTANPAEVISGETSVIKASSLTGLTIKDNGTDVTSQFTQRQDTAESYSVTNITTTYGFALNNNDYYESNNKAHASSAAVCRVDFYVPVAATITFSLINYAEATYDYGQLSNIDETLTTNASADTSHVYWDGKNNNSASVQTVTYTMAAGDHYIYVKYFKDQYTDSNNDSLQFKVAITLNEPFTPSTYYGYDITNIQADHTIVVTSGSTATLFFKNNGTWVTATKAYKKVNGAWVLQSDLSAVFDANTKYVKG